MTSKRAKLVFADRYWWPFDTFIWFLHTLVLYSIIWFWWEWSWLDVAIESKWLSWSIFDADTNKVIVLLLWLDWDWFHWLILLLLLLVDPTFIGRMFDTSIFFSNNFDKVLVFWLCQNYLNKVFFPFVQKTINLLLFFIY